jgi:hypothetical protein
VVILDKIKKQARLWVIAGAKRLGELGAVLIAATLRPANFLVVYYY